MGTAAGEAGLTRVAATVRIVAATRFMRGELGTSPGAKTGLARRRSGMGDTYVYTL